MGKRYKPEEIVMKLRQVDVLTGQGSTVASAVRQIGVTEYTYYRWRKEYGGLQTNQIKRIKDLEQENARLRKAVSDLTLDKLILQEASRGNPPALLVAGYALRMSGKLCRCPSAGFAVCSGSTVRRSARCRMAVTTRIV
jgi:transposase-like protein